MDLSLRHAYDFTAVTPSDSVFIQPSSDGVGGAPTIGLYIGTSGDVTCLNAAGDPITFVEVPVGILYIATTRVNDTGTDADDIVALY